METQGGSLIGSLLPLIVLFGIFYFLIIRPQQKQQKDHDNMINSLSKGDKIVTNGGIILEITKIEENYYEAKNKDGANFTVANGYISSKWEG